MKAIEEIAHTAAWQIYEEIGTSKHSVERMEEIIAERLTEQKAIDIEKACEWFKKWCKDSKYYTMEESIDMLRKAMEE